MLETSRAVRELSPLSMPLEEAMRTQRAVRRLKPDPVDELLRIDLPRGPEPAPRGARVGARRSAHHAAAVEQPAGATDPRPPVERRAVRRDSPRLAAGALRAHHAPPHRRSRARRPLRQPAFSRPLAFEPFVGGLRTTGVTASPTATAPGAPPRVCVIGAGISG